MPFTASICSIRTLLPEHYIRARAICCVSRRPKICIELKRRPDSSHLELSPSNFNCSFISTITMRVDHYLTLVILACIGHITAFVITAGSNPAAATALAAVITAADLKRINVPIPSTLVTSLVTLQAPLSAIITAAPTSTVYVIRRQTQKCFDDRGFQVDCATWTGYYCKCSEPPSSFIRIDMSL
jgi:hypothetical protein